MQPIYTEMYSNKLSDIRYPGLMKIHPVSKACFYFYILLLLYVGSVKPGLDSKNVYDK